MEKRYRNWSLSPAFGDAEKRNRCEADAKSDNGSIYLSPVPVTKTG